MYEAMQSAITSKLSLYDIISMVVPGGISLQFQSCAIIRELQLVHEFIVLIIIILLPSFAFAATKTVSVGDFKYILNSSTNTASVKGLATGVNKLDSVFIPDKVEYNKSEYLVTSIESSAFYTSNVNECKVSGSLKLPQFLKTISSSAFANCATLTGPLVIPSEVESIGDEAFNNCSGLTGKLIIPNNASVGVAAFQDCVGFTELELPEKIVLAGQVFKGCVNLKGTLTITKEHTLLEWKAIFGQQGYHFSECGFKKIIIDTDVTQLPDYCFLDCKGVESIVVKCAVKFGCYVFRGADNLKEITCASETPPTHTKGSFFMGNGKYSDLPYCAFSSVYPRDNPSSSQFPYNSVNVYVPESSITKYKKEFEWKTFKNLQASSPLPEQIIFDKEQCEIKIGKSLLLQTQIYPENTDKTLTWSSSNDAVASVTDGVVTANGWGTAIITATTVNGLTASCEVTVWMKGDVNNDGAINIADVTLTSSYIAGIEPSNFSTQVADINEDGDITITDAVMIAQMVLSAKNITAKSSLHLKARSINGATLDASFNGNQIGLSTSADNITALQADVVLSKGVTASNIHLTDCYLNSHLLMTAQRGENVVRLVVFSPDNSLLVPGEDIIMIDTNDGVNVNVENILVSDAQGRTKDLTLQRNDMTTSIDEISSENSVRINIIEGGIIVDGAFGCEITCYDIYGRISAHVIRATESQAIQLPEGVNIVKVNNLIKSIYIK